MRRGNVASALQYVPELTWILFLRILDETEDREAAEAEAVGARYTPSLKKPYRWKDWAAPAPKDAPEKWTNKRKELEEGPPKGFLAFCNGELIPYLKALREKGQASSRQKVISEIMSGVEKVRIDPSLPGSALDLYHMPYTHSLPAVIVWSAAALGLARLARLPWAAAAAIAATVFSHKGRGGARLGAE